MGQGSSRNQSNPSDRRTRDGLSEAAQPPASHNDTQPEEAAPSRSRSRRYSSNVADLLRRRPSPDATNQESSAVLSSATATAVADSQTLRRRSRLARAGTSFTNTIPSIFTRNTSPSMRSFDRRRLLSPPPVYHDLEASTDSASVLPALPEPRTPDLDLLYDLPSPTLSQSTSQSDRRRREDNRPSTLADRLSSLTPARAFPNRTTTLRRRRSPLGRTEDQGAMLSRLLSIVAAATASTLMGGNPEAAMSDLRNATGGIEGDDGNFNGFLQALRNGRVPPAHARPSDGSAGAELGGGDVAEGGEGGEAVENPDSLEFFRMFRFGSSSNTPRRRAESPRPSSTRSGVSRHSSAHGDTPEDGAEHRMVPILIVGIRALNGEDEGRNGLTPGVPSFLDALTSVPANFDLGMDTSDGSTGSGDGVRISRRRRASLGGLNNLFSSARDVNRQARPSISSRSRSEIPSSSGSTLSESPPGPNPPPSTPASNPHSTLSSGSSTPTNRTASFYSGAQAVPSPRRNSLLRRMTGTVLEPTAEESSSSPLFPDEHSQHSRPQRYRRLSDSDTPRFGSGSSRRNGVFVEPSPSLYSPPFSRAGNGDYGLSDHDQNANASSSSDNADAGTTTNRSWIIFILGGSYPENHPILSTPSLFTDSPTYEDMLLLSSLLGPAKPPVATADEVAQAPGILKIRIQPGGVVSAVSIPADDNTATEMGMEDTVEEILAIGERCLVCLCDYEDGEEVRKLVKCGHLFHKECIDQWLTTGRNSCPLCRGQGVDEKAKPQSGSQSPQEATAEAS